MKKWEGKVSNYRQLGGIETSVLDNGKGRGTRIAWIDTGAGLRFKVVLDRAMDVAEAFYNSYGLGWVSHSGVTPPNPSATEGIRWLNSFGGGLITTCGLTHVGGPEEDKHGKRGLHDRISNIPAEVESIVQPDLASGDLEMSITGKMLQSSVFGPHLELKRTISATLGSPVLNIHDEVTNRGNRVAPHMLLYHVNFGWPLVDEGAQLVWEGDWESRDEESSKIFNDETNFKRCPPPIEDHRGFGEAAAFLDLNADQKGICHCGVRNSSIGVGLDLSFPKSQMPWVTNWQHWGRNEYVTALEPGTHPPIGQSTARENGTLIDLEVGETRSYDLKIEINNM
ncbi:aldose 1-epimerase family protein [Aliifodinibius sp. S!AR15-10]|uniref:aldose 1-epimerase family protein n=1 Tax=Aliifodinibius sp. S!AR15-10 TaxID=2950437 RepID=UPI00286722DA|nr:aldose 1-epimerase family protein [Aliifodinibius sp. S!AR15-10]MDR8392705.1 aldose 1-epimerase family protein [Aliifodinibius sp. S!AR15-10]